MTSIAIVIVILAILAVTIAVTTISILIIMKHRTVTGGGGTPTPPSPTATGAHVYESNPWIHYSCWSQAAQTFPTIPGFGRDDTGTYIGTDLTATEQLHENGYTTALDLDKYPLTYPIGHDYYTAGVDGDTAAFGTITGSWSAYVANVADLKAYISAPNPLKVVVIEAPRDGTQRKPVAIKSDLNVTGIVVRHGGVLVVDDAQSINIRTNFILVESGGLLQVGTPLYRYGATKPGSKLTITLTHSVPYVQGGVVTSQYGANVYAPGITPYTGNTDDLKTSYTGMQMYMNTFGTKTIGVGFNGNYQLNGVVGTPVAYNGTWSATQTNSSAFISSAELMTPSAADPSKAEQANMRTDYTPMWVRLAPGSYLRGQTTIKLDTRDFGTGTQDAWKVGAQIVVTGSSKQYTTPEDLLGMLPIWIGSSDSASAAANTAANTTFAAQYVSPSRIYQQSTQKYDGAVATGISEKTSGIEVCTIASISGNTLTLSEPLRFDHICTKTRVTGSQFVVDVDTQLHVGLLSRNILITSDLTSGGLVSFADLWHWRTVPSGQADLFMAIDMRSGLENQSADNMMAMMMGTATTPIPPPRQRLSTERPLGPGGSLICNYDPYGSTPSDEVYTACFGPMMRHMLETDPSAQAALVSTKFCDDKIPGTAQGHWMFSTAGRSGSGAIYGGQQMFRYGSSVRMDGVELKHMGTPANFGSVGQYAIHFHLGGYPTLFKGYLPDGETSPYSREAKILNVSIWACFSRWVTIHGTHNVMVRNSLGFVSYGSGFFTEDGTETQCSFEHNIGIATLNCAYNPYFNPLPIYPNVGSDVCMASTYWFKNSQTRAYRNVACCSPTPVIGFWYVPQKIGKLRGPSAVCIGSPTLGLPGMAGVDNLAFHNGSGMSQFSTGAEPLIINWVPTYMYDYVSTITRGDPYTSSNDVVPYQLNAENIIYCMFGGLSEFPEAIAAGPSRYDGYSDKVAPLGSPPDYTGTPNPAQPTGFLGCPALPTGCGSQPTFLPSNGQISCTDRHNIAQAIYFQTRFGGDEDFDSGMGGYPFVPIAQSALIAYNAKRITETEIIKGEAFPKIVSCFLTWNLGASTSLWGGPGWVKQVPAFLINCCFIETSYRISTGTNTPMSMVDGHEVANYESSFSTAFVTGSGSNGTSDAYAGIYVVLWNLISNGAVALPSNPTVIGGPKMLIGNTASIMGGGLEFNNKDGATNNYFFFDLAAGAEMLTHIPSTFWTSPVAMSAVKYYVMGLFNMDTKMYRTVIPTDAMAGPNVMSGSAPFSSLPSSPPIPGIPELFSVKTRKYPYLCGPITGPSGHVTSDGLVGRTDTTTCRLFRISESSDAAYGTRHPEFFDIVANTQSYHFLSAYALALGDKLANYLAAVPQCLPAVNQFATGFPPKKCAVCTTFP